MTVAISTILADLRNEILDHHCGLLSKADFPASNPAVEKRYQDTIHTILTDRFGETYFHNETKRIQALRMTPGNADAIATAKEIVTALRTAMINADCPNLVGQYLVASHDHDNVARKVEAFVHHEWCVPYC